MKIQSTPITFIDQTDSRKLEAYITSNLPTVQIFNQNSGAHTPDWRESENLVLSMDVFLDSRNMTVAEYNGTAIKWYKNDVEMTDGSIEDISDDKRKITIKDNILKDDAIITYTCEVTYQGIKASTRITFTRVDTGLNGNDGADGTSVNIKGTASSVTPVSGTDYYTITYSGGDISAAELNDAYMYNGDLYVCVDSRDGVDYFINVGRIQGPAGEPAKNIVLSGSAQVFKISKTNAYTPTAISVTAHAFNTSTINWTYSTNGGQTFLSTVPTGVSRNGNIVTVTGSTLASNSIVVKASDGAVEDVFTIYKAFDGTDGSDGDKGDPAPLVFLTNENISFAANTSGQISLTAFTTNVVAYVGTTKTTPTIGTITGLPTGMTVSTPVMTANELILTFTIANNSTFGAATSNSGTITIPVTSPVSTNLTLNWSKINTGATGAAGADAYTVLLTNESHVFAGSTSAAIASSATTQVLSYKGTTSQSATIVSVNGVAASTASTATGIAGLSFQCSALSGTSPTITFTCTTAFVSPNGTIPIVIKVGSISITKMFTYSIAFKGATGGTGSVGPASSSYWLVSNASAVQKTSSGDILCTPATLTFTGRIQTGTSAPANYAGRWILAYSTDGSTYTDSYTSTANEATASIAASSTYKAVRARMYLAGGTTTLLDEQIIPFVSDGETGAIGAPGDPGVTFQVYSNNGYALSTGVPTILLQTFAYLGDVEITAGATFQWYRHNGTDWVAVSGATNSYFNVSRDDVSFSNNYMCKMQFNGTEYVGVVTIEDKNDENRVFAAKPLNYFAGDLWIVGTDYTPHGYAVGTMLRAEHTNSAYTDSDWVPATKYDDEIRDLRNTVDSYKQYFSVNSTNGLQIGSSSINNGVLTTDRVEATTINSDAANIETLNITGRYSGSTMLQAPILNLGNFSLVIESNGSLSIVANT